jgi:hypothetical protein
MRKLRVVALVLACVILLAGCSLVRPDEERIAMQTVATVNGTQIYKYEVNEDSVASSVQEILYYSGQSESDYSPEQLEEMYSEQRNSILDTLVEEEVMLQKAAELGYVLTEEEKADLMVTAEEYFDRVLDSFISQIEAENAEAAGQDAAEEGDIEIITNDPDSEEETPPDPEVVAEAEERLQEVLDENRMSLEIYHEYLCEQELIGQVKEYMRGLAEVTDEDVKTWYDQTLAIQQEEMDAMNGPFEDLVSLNKIYTYVPQRIVAVRDVLIAFDETLASQAKVIYDSDDMEAYNDFMSDLLEKNSDSMTTAMNIKARIEAGEEISDIVDELSVDMENISEQSTPKGLLIDPRTTSYSSDYVEVAQGLKNIGDIAEPFANYEGVHILQLVEVYEPGVVPFEELKDSIKTALRPGAEQDKYQELLEAWVEEADIKYFYNRLDPIV